MAKSPRPEAEPHDPTTETRQAKRTRAALLRAARVVFETRGYTRTRLEDITDEAGYAAGSFYTYFDSKEAIFSEVIRSLGTNLDQPRPRRPAGPRRGRGHDPDMLERRIRASNDRYFRSLATDGRLWAVVEEAAHREDAPRSILNERWRRFRVGVTDALKQWQADGVVDRHLDLGSAVNSLSAMTEWLVTLRRVYGFSFPALIGSAACTWAWMRTLTAPGARPPTVGRRRAHVAATAAPTRSDLAGPAASGAKLTTRDRLVEAGFEELSSDSLAKVRVADIARTAGVSVGSFYRYFPSKSDLLAAVLTSKPSLLFQPPEVGGGPAAAIDAVNRHHVGAVHAQTGFRRTVAEAALSDPLIRAIVNEQRAGWMAALAEVVGSWTQAGQVDPSIDPVVATVCLAALTVRSPHLLLILEDQRSTTAVVDDLDTCWHAILRVSSDSVDLGPVTT